MKLLLVEDDERIGSGVAEILRRKAYAVDWATTGDEASRLMFDNDYDAVILDWGIPEPTGIELLREWREEGNATPILMLTGHCASEEVVSGLDQGADDYLTKPFVMDELLARLRSLLRRRAKSLDFKLQVADLELDRVTHQVHVAECNVQLSPKEFALLEYLLARKNEVVTRTEIEEHVWDSAIDSFSNFVDVTIHRLRKKIDGNRNGRLIHNVRGAGFVLRSERC